MSDNEKWISDTLKIVDNVKRELEQDRRAMAKADFVAVAGVSLGALAECVRYWLGYASASGVCAATVVLAIVATGITGMAMRARQ